ARERGRALAELARRQQAAAPVVAAPVAPDPPPVTLVPAPPPPTPAAVAAEPAAPPPPAPQNEPSCRFAAPHPMKMGGRPVILDAVWSWVRGRRCLWCDQPGNEPGPDLGPTHVGPHPVVPATAGSTPRKLLLATRSPHGPDPGPRGFAMEILHRCCAGLDVHKTMVVACVRTPGPDGQASSQVRTVGTMTADLLALADGLQAQ